MRRVALLLTFVAACSGSPTGTAGDAGATIAVFNVLDADESMTLRLDGRTIPLPESGLKVSEVVSAGQHRIDVNTSNGLLNASRQFRVIDGAGYAVLVAHSSAGLVSLTVIRDSVGLPPPNEIKVRVMNLTDGVEPLRAWLRINGAAPDAASEIAPDFPSGYGTDSAFTGYLIRSPGVHVVTVTASDGTTVRAENFKHLAGGHVWNAVLVRTAADEREVRLFRDR